jgi:uncharacterized membrane protein
MTAILSRARTGALALASTAVVVIFIDATWPHRWGCHRLPDRSFALKGRQLHLCARCTGITTGLACSILLIPIRSLVVVPALVAWVVLAADGGTQYYGWRTSTNALRFLTGLAFGSTLVPALLAIGGL